MYQALQNGMFGFGAICGASFGGSIADGIGWRWCFLLQVPISAFALFVGALVIKNPQGGFDLGRGFRETWSRVDFSGALVLVLAISIQLVGLSLGGNELSWGSGWVIASLVGSTLLFVLFFVAEAKTRAIPVIPLRLLKGNFPILVEFANICVGLSAYAVSTCLLHIPRGCVLTCFRQLNSTSSTCLCSSRWFCLIQQRQPVSDWLFHPWQPLLGASWLELSCQDGESC